MANFTLSLYPLVVVISITGLLIWLSKSSKLLLNKSDLIGAQKFHDVPTPRIAGISIFMGFFTGVYLKFGLSHIFFGFFVSSLPVFLGGLLEDLFAKTSPTKRMAGALISALIAFILLDIRINELGFEFADYLLSFVLISLIFTVLAISVTINAINMIDGFNGLMLGYSILVTIALAYIGNTLGDELVFELSLILLFSLLGLFVLNFPYCMIFAGDGGAYLIGLLISIIGLLLVMRNPEVSHWFVLLLLIYPLFEVVFSILRKKIVQGISPSRPDSFHLHMLIYKFLIKSELMKNNSKISNSLTSPFLWLLSLIGIIPAILWFDNQTILIAFAIFFMAVYCIIYLIISKYNYKLNSN